MDFHDMERFRTGQSEEGHEQFSIPLQPDDDGMVGRECPNSECETKYFKLSVHADSDKPEETDEVPVRTELVCPYCGEKGNFQQFHTEAQVEWIKSMLFRDVARAFGNMLADAFRPLRKRSGSLISVEVKRGHLPAVRQYVEEKLRQTVACDTCKGQYAVYGISFLCPFCGEGTFTQHLSQSIKTVRVLAEEADRIGAVHGPAVRESMYGNAYEDVVSLFEGFLKVIYRYSVKKRYSAEDAEKLLAKVKVNFQRLAGADEFFTRDLGIGLFGSLSSAERTTLETVFAKRHVLTHNLGLVDGKYRDQVRAWERQGAEVPLDRQELLESLSLVEKIVGGVTVTLNP